MTNTKCHFERNAMKREISFCEDEISLGIYSAPLRMSYRTKRNEERNLLVNDEIISSHRNNF